MYLGTVKYAQTTKISKNHNSSHFSLVKLNFNMRLFPCIFHLKPYSVFDSMF